MKIWGLVGRNRIVALLLFFLTYYLVILQIVPISFLPYLAAITPSRYAKHHEYFRILKDFDKTIREQAGSNVTPVSVFKEFLYEKRAFNKVAEIIAHKELTTARQDFHRKYGAARHYGRVKSTGTTQVEFCPLSPGQPTFPTSKSCVPAFKSLIVIPYRDRAEHLHRLAANLTGHLRRSNVSYVIVVAEQVGNGPFNKGVLMNAAFMEMWSQAYFHCVLFHDVDMLPEDLRNVYTCSASPKHMSPEVSTLEYTLPYYKLVGGVCSYNVDDFMTLNGFSNLFWGWGGEDDNMAQRIIYKKWPIVRPAEGVGRYYMVDHKKRTSTDRRQIFRLLRWTQLLAGKDGLNTLSYRVISSHILPLYVHLKIDVGEVPPGVLAT